MQIYLCFPGGKHKALTMSYDDGKYQDRKLIEIFNKYGIKGTFHLNSDLLTNPERISKDEINSLYQGHEVSAHTCTHPTIARCPKEQIVQNYITTVLNLNVLLDILYVVYLILMVRIISK